MVTKIYELYTSEVSADDHTTDSKIVDETYFNLENNYTEVEMSEFAKLNVGELVDISEADGSHIIKRVE